MSSFGEERGPKRPGRAADAGAEPRPGGGGERQGISQHAKFASWLEPGAPVQADGALEGPDVHAHAARGVGGGGGALPHVDRIQQSFGHHDVSGVRAHVGGAAAEASAAIGARAYATGDDVAFARAPDVRQAAHEAAHVVQQRGGVRLDGGVGRAGDPYERHADEVADLVVRGESAEARLDPFAHRGAAGGPAVQRDMTPEQQEAAIQHAIQAVTQNESGGRAVAPQSGMNTSAPNAREPERGQHASYASASQMIPSHALGVLRGSDDGRGLAAKHGLNDADLDDAAATIAASNRIWDQVVLHHLDYAQLRARFQRDLDRTGFTESDIARMIQFRGFRTALRDQRGRTLALVAAARARLEQQATEVAAQIAQLRAEAGGAAAQPPADPAAHEAPAEPADAHAEQPPASAPPPAAAQVATPEGGDGQVAALGPEEGEAALAALSDRDAAAVAGIRGFARPDRWDSLSAAQRAAKLRTASNRLASARRAANLDHVSHTAADTLITRELQRDPRVAAMGYDESMIRPYIHSEAHFLQRFNEDRAGWVRYALQNRPMHGQAPLAPGQRPAVGASIDDAIGGAAGDGGGHTLTNIDFQHRLRAFLHTHPHATEEQVVREAARINSGGSATYITHIVGIWRSQGHSSAT
jgi:Domain of unknown function (DUF4157)